MIERHSFEIVSSGGVEFCYKAPFCQSEKIYKIPFYFFTMLFFEYDDGQCKVLPVLVAVVFGISGNGT